MIGRLVLVAPLCLLCVSAPVFASERNTQVIADAVYLKPQRLVTVENRRRLNIYCIDNRIGRRPDIPARDRRCAPTRIEIDTPALRSLQIGGPLAADFLRNLDGALAEVTARETGVSRPWVPPG